MSVIVSWWFPQWMTKAIQQPGKNQKLGEHINEVYINICTHMYIYVYMVFQSYSYIDFC